MPAETPYYPPGVQRLLLGVLITGLLVADAGIGMSFVAGFPSQMSAVVGAGVGIALFVLAIMSAHRLAHFTILDRSRSGGVRYDLQKNWGKLKIASVLLDLLAFLAAIVLLGALLHRIGLLQANFESAATGRFAYILLAALVSSMFAATYLALRSPAVRGLRRFDHILFGIAAATCLTLTGFGIWLLQISDEVRTFVSLHPEDAPFVLLAAAVCAAIAASVSRRLPNLYTLVTQQQGADERAGYVTRNKSVVLPVVMALSLMLLMLFMFILLEVGLSGFAGRLQTSRLLLTTIGLILIAFATSLGIALSLARAQARPALFQAQRSDESKRIRLVTIVSLGLSGALAIASLLVFLRVDFVPASWPHRVWVDLAAFAVLMAAGPYGFYAAHRATRIRKMEEKFPDFLRDLAAGRRAGLTFETALATAAKGEYGALTPEIQKMSDQLSWHVPFDEVLLALADRVRTPLIERAVSVIVAAGRTGGQVTDILTSVASDVREIKNLEIERRSAMGLYTMVVYVIFLVFLLTVAVLYGTFLPKTLAATGAAEKLGSTGTGGLTFNSIPLESFRTFYFLAVIVQGIGTGLVGGVLETGRWAGGLRHAFVMVLMGWITFTWLL